MDYQLISRKEAKSRGFSKYYTGIACKNGHVAERYVRPGNPCVECIRIKNKTRLNREAEVRRALIQPRKIRVSLPVFHEDQVKAFEFSNDHRFMAMRCGRRWGKTAFGVTLLADRALKGWPVGWFAPEWRFLHEPYSGTISALSDAVVSASEMKGQIHTLGGGKIDFWSLDNVLAGRGRKYQLVVIDEAAFGKKQMVDQWRLNIRPTLVDLEGAAIVMSNTNGTDPDQFFYKICHDSMYQFEQFHAPSMNNPYLPIEELEEWRRTSDPLVWRQEALAEFVDWSGVAFFQLDKMLVEGQPVEHPPRCDVVFSVIDSATKTGRENDGTAVSYWAYTRNPAPGMFPLVLLDWDIQQIEGALLETWLPAIFATCENYARECKARQGSAGAWIEDKASGMVLLQHAARRNWPAHAIDSKLTSLGKSERAINASSSVFIGKVKFSRVALEKTVIYKGVSRNHMESQVTGFRVGNKESEEDDLLDTFCYAIALSLGNDKGF